MTSTIMNKLTNKSTVILKTLQSMKGFCTAQQIHKEIPQINLTTVYRNLEKFTQMGLVQKISLRHQESAYEFSQHKHHHTICDSCNEIRHITLTPTLFKKIPEMMHVDPSSIEVIIRGKCK
jgi:Fe2+ or Zn2+ uptake regulation protein